MTATKTNTLYNGLDLPTVQYNQAPAVTWYIFGSNVAQRRTKTLGNAITNNRLEAYLTGNSVIVNTPLNASANRGLVTTATYNAAGDQLSVTKTPTGAASDARTTSFEYDKLVRRTRVVSPNPVTGVTTTPTDIRLNGGYVTSYQYDNLSNLLSVTDPLGNRTAQSYDDLNRVVSQSLPHATIAGAAGPTTTYAYTRAARGWNVATANANGQTVLRSADALGRTVSVSGDAPMQSWTYFTDGAVKSATDALSSMTNYDYTLRGQLKSITSPAPASGGARPVTQYAYFADGQVSSVTDPLLRTTSYIYLPSGRVGTVTQPDPDATGPLLASTMSYQYDSIGNLRRETDSLSNATVYDYDSLFRRISTTDPKNAVTRISYNLFDEVTSVTDPLNNLTNYIYNKVGQLVTERKVVSGVNLDRNFSYDGAGNLRSARDRNGRDRFLSYDNLYRNTAETWQTGTAVNQSFGFSYDAIGNLTAVTDSSSLGTNFQFTYDARNQLQLERQTAKINDASFVLDRDYDAEGKLVRNSVNIGGTIVAGSNQMGQASLSLKRPDPFDSTESFIDESP